MYNILIIDDEPFVVDGLFEFFSNVKHLDLDIHRAYSGIEALDLLKRIKMDIVLSDIRMPGITGIELLNQINMNWPKCRVIFLTGYDDFEYVHNAIQNNAFNYLLKTEGDEAILKAVEDAIAEIEKEVKDEQLVYNAKLQMRMAIPLLRQEYLLNLLDGDISPLDIRERRFVELEIPLKVDLHVLLLAGKVDCWPADFDPSGKTQLLYGIQSLTEQHMISSARVIPVIYEHSKLLWLIQPEDETVPWEKLIAFFKNRLESIQTSCRELFKLSVSFALSSEPVSWEKAGGKFDILKLILNRGFGLGNEMLLMDNALSEFEPGVLYNSNPDLQKVRSGLKKVELLEAFIENGQQKEFCELFSEIIYSNNVNKSRCYNLTLEVYYSVALLFLSYLNRWGLMAEIATKIDLSRLTRIEGHGSWEEAAGYFQRLAAIIFENKTDEQEKITNEVINRAQQYINAHLKEELSLVKLAEQVYLNPSYLSRLYKQVTGKNLFDYINEARLSKAKELLKKSNMKIHEIAAAIGHESASYFTRYFKKETNMTPQEYRDSLNASRGVNGLE